MSRSFVLLAALTDEPTSTSDLCERVGYAELIRLGLIPYEAFRAELIKLSRAGLAEVEAGRDGATAWRLPEPRALARGADRIETRSCRDVDRST